MSRSRGKRYDDTPKLNKKKVLATIIAIIVIIMIIISLQKILTGTEKTKEFSTLESYVSAYDGKWGVIDNKGNVIINLSYDEMVIVPDKNTDLFVCMYDVNYDNGTYKTKVLDKDGKEILTDFNMVEPIENSNKNNVWYESVLKFQKDGKYGLIDFKGKEVLKPEYDNIYALSSIEKSIIIEKDGKKGLVNPSTGEIVVPTEYIEISALSEKYEDGYIVKNADNKVGLIAADKRIIFNAKYDEIKNISGSNYYVVVENGTQEVVTKDGEVVLNKGFNTVEEISVENFVITLNGKYAVIDKTGATLIAPEYDNLKYAFSNYYIAQKDSKYGIVDTAGSIKVNFEYESISYIESGNFFAAEGADYKTNIIDSSFNTVLQNIIISELNTEIGYLRVRQDNEYKYYNFKLEEKSNKEILATNTLFLVKENGKYGYENKNGDRIVDCIYDDAKEQNEFGYCAVKKDGLWGVLKSDGTVLLQPQENLEEYLYVDFIAEWHRINDLTLNAYTK